MALFAAAATGNIQQLQSLIEEDSEFDVNCLDTSGKTLLHIASEEGHLETVNYLLHHHRAQMEKTDTAGQTPLHVASKKGHLQILKALLEEGADVNKCDNDGFTSLHLSSFEGHQDIVQYLVKEGAELDTVSRDYWTPLHLAIRGGHLNIVKYLSEKGADINICSNSRFTALHTSSQSGNIDGVNYLISQGAELNECTDDGWTPLSIASHGGHLDIVEVLVNAEAEIDKALEDGMTPLLLATRGGHSDIVEFLLKKGAATDKGNGDGFTALHTASSHGHLEIVRYLVRKGAALDQCGNKGRTPLYCASQEGHLEIVQYLLNEGADIRKCDNDGLSVLHIASLKGHLDIVKYLALKGAELDSRDNTGRTPLHCASQEGYLEIVEYLINEGADVKKFDVRGFAALHITSFKGHFDIVKYLAEKRVDLEILSNSHWTPLNLAIAGGHLNIVKFLLKNGVNINMCSKNGFTALHTASQCGNIDGVKYLISHGAKLNECTDYGWTPLSLASYEGHLDVVEVLVNARVEIDKALEDGMTPLLLATRGGHLDIVKVLLKKGAATDMSNGDGFTALHTASSHGHLEIVRYLVEKQATLNKYDAYNRTPLFYASQGGHFDVVQYLINKGADFGQYDKRGLTALHIASLKGHVDIVRYLVRKGADVLQLTDDELTPLQLALDYGHRDVIDVLKSEEAKKPNKIFSGLSKAGKKMKDSKIYDEWASFAPTHYVTISSRRKGDAVSQNDLYAYTDFAELSVRYMNVLPKKTPMESTLPSHTVIQRQTLRDPTKIFRKDKLIRLLNNGGIEARIPPSDADKDITVEALTNVPPDLTLEKDETLFSVGLKLSPTGLQFKTPVKITLLHSAIFTKPKQAEIVLYTRRTSSDDFSRIVPSADECPRCIVRHRDLTLYIDHFSEWWIISYIKRYFIGKRLMCTPYVPISPSRDVMNYVLLNIRDNIHGTEEDDIAKFKVAFPGEQYSVRWGQGPLKITHLEDKEEVSTMTLEESAFYDTTTNRIPFVLKQRTEKLAGILITFILKQKFTKHITFQMIYDAVEMRHESRGTQASLAASSVDSEEPRDDGRGISQAPLSSPDLAEALGSSQHRQSSAEPEGTDDGSKVLMSPRSSSPPHVESLHRFQVTHTAEAAVVAVGAEGTTGALASPSFAANILQEVAPGVPVDHMRQRQGNVAIYVREINISNPQGDSSTTGPVPIASIIPQRLKHELRCRLNRESPIRQDWKGLASELELDEYINSLEQYKNPTEELLVIAESSKKIQNLEDLAKAFHRMNRGDCEELCQNYAFEGKRITSADAHKDPMKDEDTDSSDDF